MATQEERTLQFIKDNPGVKTEDLKIWGLKTVPAITCADRLARKLKAEGKIVAYKTENSKTKIWKAATIPTNTENATKPSIEEEVNSHPENYVTPETIHSFVAGFNGITPKGREING